MGKGKVFLILILTMAVLVAGCTTTTETGPEWDNAENGKGQVEQPGEPVIIEADRALRAQLMGQNVDLWVELEFGKGDIALAGMAVGENYLAVQEERTGELVFFLRETLEEIGRTGTDFDSLADRTWEGFFWGDLLVSTVGDTAAVYGVTDGEVVPIWEDQGHNIGIELVGEEGNQFLLVFSRSWGEIPDLEIFQQTEGGLISVWRNEEWSISDLLPYAADDSLLLATADQGWLYLNLGDFSASKLGIGGPFEAAIWDELQRTLEGERMVYQFHGSGGSGEVLASARGTFLSPEGRERYGAYYQLWVPAQETLKLVAENFLQVSEIRAWHFEEEEGIYTDFIYHQGTSSWFNHQVFGDFYSWHSSILELDRSAWEKAVAEGNHGERVRIAPGDSSAPAPLGKFFIVGSQLGDRSATTRMPHFADFSGGGRLELLWEFADGVHLVFGGEEGSESVRVTGPHARLGAVDEKHRHVYFLIDDQLLRLTYTDMVDVKRQTALPSPEAMWSEKVEGRIAALAEKGELLYLIEYNDQREKGFFRALDKATGQEQWEFEIEYGSSDKLSVTRDRVRFVDSDGRLYHLEPGSGELLAEVQLEYGQNDAWGGAWSQVQLIEDNAVYISKWAPPCGSLLAFDASSGERLWTFEADHGGIGSVSLIDGLLYVGAGDLGKGFLYVIDPATGQEKEKYETGINATTPTVIKDNILLSGGYGEGDHTLLYALDLDSGARIWEFEVGYKVLLEQFAVADNTVFTAGGGDGYWWHDRGLALHALAIGAGRPQWINRWSGFYPRIEEADGTLYITDSNYYLYAIAAESGEIQWKFNPGISTSVGSIALNPYLSFVVVDGDALYYAAFNTLQRICLEDADGNFLQ